MLKQKPARNSRPFPPVADDSLYLELEARYGGAFAQWVMDRCPDAAPPRTASNMH